jgi:hypothetical protein
MKKVLEYDNIVPKLYQEHIKHTLLNTDFNWHFIEDLTYDKSSLAKEKYPGFVHKFFHEEEICSEYHNLILPLALSIADKIGLENFNLLRARTFLHLPSNNSCEIRNNFHTDYSSDVNHLSCIYYVQSSDGCTILADKTNKECDSDSLTDKNIDVKIKPKQGKVIVFNGHWHHCSSSPTTESRCIISFNFLL